MPLKLPNLDDRRWSDLVEEGRSLIPAWAPGWTNYNTSDPGITLLELFAFLTENLIYRANYVTDANTRTLLRLIRGPEWTAGPDLEQDTRETIRLMHLPARAVTMSDYEELTLRVNETLGQGETRIARVMALANRNLESGRPNTQLNDAPGHVSVVVVPEWRGERSDVFAEHVPAALFQQIRSALESARLLTTVVHVVPVQFVEFGVRLAITVHRGLEAEKIRAGVARALKSFFDPIRGGPDGSGWPFGRSIYVSELYQVAASVPGVISVSSALDNAKHPVPEVYIAGHDKKRIIRNQANKPEAITLRADELARAVVRPEELLVNEGGGER